MYSKIIYVSDFKGSECNQCITIAGPTEARVGFFDTDGRVGSNNPSEIAIVDAIRDDSTKKVQYKISDINGLADDIFRHENLFDSPEDAIRWAYVVGGSDYAYDIVRVVTIETTLLNQNQSK